jgi:hypothetical protein
MMISECDTVAWSLAMDFNGHVACPGDIDIAQPIQGNSIT